MIVVLSLLMPRAFSNRQLTLELNIANKKGAAAAARYSTLTFPISLVVHSFV